MKKLTPEKINLLRHNARSAVRELGLLNDAYFEIGVTLAERHLLIELMSFPSPTMGEIAERLLLEKSTASRLIAKAVKKGYVKCSSDEKDKRKRFLHLTELGKRTLNAFEPIAFNQTKEALETLTNEEIEVVYKGVELYAKGLKTARLQHKTVESKEQAEEASKKAIHAKNLLKIHKKLSQLRCTLELYNQKDESGLYSIFKEVMDSDCRFPFESGSMQEFYRQFLDPKSHVYVCHSSTKKVIGGFCIKSNFSGRSSHIANAAYMIKKGHRGKGIGTLLVKASLLIAKNLGFHAMQFNMVLSQNTVATQLYQKLGFNIIGTLPKALCNPDGSYQDGYIMHLQLEED